MTLLVLDANILIRAVLGSKAPYLLYKYSQQIEFLAPDTAFQEARDRLTQIVATRNIPVDAALETLERVAELVRSVDVETYSAYEAVARLRIERRDIDDWPVLATALAFSCPIWTEDTDFFGCGLATWTTDRVELFLANARHESV